MNIKKSIIVRTRKFKINHFKYFKEGRFLKKLNNIHTGKRCFIIGNGPSLKADDLTRIYKNKDISFGFNRVFYMFDQTEWRPTYYISQDEKMLIGSRQEVNKMDIEYKFIPIEMRWHFGIHIANCHEFHLIPQSLSGNKLFSTDISRAVVNEFTVVYSAVQFAYYMGIREIFLLGIDHQFHMSTNNKGELIVDHSTKDYFSEKYNVDRQNLAIPNLERSTETYKTIKDYSSKLGIKVFNATRGGKLEVFPRVNFDTLF